MRKATEPPDEEKPRIAGRDRNRPCPCGSGRKAKRCCDAPFEQDRRAAEEENRWRKERKEREERRRRQPGGASALGIIAAVASVPPHMGPP